MKFSDGFWRNRDGFTVSSPAEVRDLEIDENSMTVYAPCIHVNNRGETLQGPLFTIRYSAPMPDVICVQIYHYQGTTNHGPEFTLNRKPDHRAQITNNPDQVCLKSGDLEVRIRKTGEWSANFYHGDQYMTRTGRKNIGYVIAPDTSTYLREQLALGVGECVYGLGERFTPFVKNGQNVDIWNADGGTSSELSYKNIPFYLTNRGYGVFVNDPGCVSFEVASEKVSNVQFSVPGEYLEYYVIGGPTPKKVLENYTSLTGKPALPPAWSFGLWLTTSFITNYDEQTVSGFIDGMAQRDLPLHVFHFDCFWMKEYQWCNFEWDQDVFPDPENMLKRLKAKGLKICVWINPYIGQKSKLFAEGMKNGFLLKRPSGDVYQCDSWQPGMGLVDFTNPEACKWFGGKLQRLADMGVDCFKTDFGERIPTDVVYFDGSDPQKMHNYYTYLYNQVVFETLEQKFGKGHAIVFARSATVGGQKFPVHWGGDCTANYESMAESLRGGLSLGLSGFGFWSHDISGFEHTATPDVYKRWTAFGLLSSHSRLHGNMSYRVPWLFDEEAVDVLRQFTKLKCSLMPYLFGAACDAAQKGLPVMRAMVLEFPEDPACAHLDRQYLLGDSLLVAPIFSETGDVSYYLPQGRWTHFLTGEKIEGGCWRQEKHDYLSLPLLVKPGSVIAVGSRNDRPDYDYADGVSFHVFELPENSGPAGVGTVVYNTEGQAELEITLKQTLQKIQIEVRGGEQPWSIYLRGISGIKSVSGGSSQPENLGMKIIPDKGVRQLEIILA